MRLSIITCTYNSEKYLQECIDSVIKQNLDIDEYEHIFVDAYSSDNTLNILENYKKKYANVKIIERNPKGVYNAMNEGIKESKGEYVLCLNSDDYLENDVIQGYLDFIEKTGKIDVYYGIMNVIRNGKKIFGVNRFFYVKNFLFKYFGTNELVFHPTCLVRRDTILEMGLFDEDKKIASDYGMWLKMHDSKKKFCYYPNNITNFREWTGSLTTSNCNLAKDEVAYYQNKYFGAGKLMVIFILNKILNLYGVFSKILQK